MKLIDLNSQDDDKIFGLIYGASGTGKTHLIATLADLGKVLVIDIDQGYKTIKFAQDLQSRRKNITVVDFKQFEDLDNAYKLVSANDPKKWSTLLGTTVAQPFDWVVWDTWSEIQWYMQIGLRAKDKELQSGNGGEKLEYRKNFGIQHWGMITDLNKFSVEKLRECSVNQIFTMQERMDKDELSGQTYGGPAIHGKLVQEMPAYFDLVVRTYNDVSGAFCATTKPKGKWVGKTRLGAGAEYKNPTMKQILGWVGI